MKRKEQCIGMSTVELHSNLSRLFTWRGTWFFEQELGLDYNRDFWMGGHPSFQLTISPFEYYVFSFHIVLTPLCICQNFMHYVRTLAGTHPTRQNLQVKIGTANEITQNIYCQTPWRIWRAFYCTNTQFSKHCYLLTFIPFLNLI